MLITDPSWEQGVELFSHLVQPKPTLILVGGVHIAIPLVQIADTVGFDVIVIDPADYLVRKVDSQM